MTAREKRLVRESFGVAAEDADGLALLFYGRLFAMDPKLRRMFHGDIARQGRKLMDMVTVVVDGLDRFDSLRPAMRAMGQRHTAYGVEAGHYALVEQAFQWALGQALGTGTESETVAAWGVLLRDVGTEMMAGAGQVGVAR